MTKTPRTEAVADDLDDNGFFDDGQSWQEFARKLEHEIISSQNLNKQLVEVLERLLPDWHNEDDGCHGGKAAGEITWGDIRLIKEAINQAKQ